MVELKYEIEKYLKLVEQYEKAMTKDEEEIIKTKIKKQHVVVQNLIKTI